MATKNIKVNDIAAAKREVQRIAFPEQDGYAVNIDIKEYMKNPNGSFSNGGVIFKLTLDKAAQHSGKIDIDGGERGNVVIGQIRFGGIKGATATNLIKAGEEAKKKALTFLDYHDQMNKRAGSKTIAF